MNKVPHRFFRAMVLMSSGMALGCGGMSKSDGDDPPSPSGSNSGGGSGGATSAGGGTATAGSTPAGGASGAAGGDPVAGSGGATVTQPGPFPCPPEQWNCSGAQVDCGYGASADGFHTGWDLPSGCACDENRPESSADCDQGESFVCRSATTFSGGTPLTTMIPFECSCVPAQMECADACYELMPVDGFYEPICEDGSNTILCGCAFIYLK